MTSVWQEGRGVSGGRVKILGFDLQDHGFMTSVMSMQLSCGSLKNAHPLEAPVALVMIISSGIILSASSSNSSLAGSNKSTFPMLTPPGEGFTLRLSDIYGPVMEDENERTLMLLCICQVVSKQHKFNYLSTN